MSDEKNEYRKRIEYIVETEMYWQLQHTDCTILTYKQLMIVKSFKCILNFSNYNINVLQSIVCRKYINMCRQGFSLKLWPLC